jgi:hypothetical protein
VASNLGNPVNLEKIVVQTFCSVLFCSVSARPRENYGILSIFQQKVINTSPARPERMEKINSGTGRCRNFCRAAER